MSTPLEKKSPEQIAPPRFHSESAIAGRLGLSRDTVRELRRQHLAEGRDFVHQHRRVELTDAGLARLTEALRTGALEFAPATEPGTPRQLQAVPGPGPRALIGWPHAGVMGQVVVKLKAWAAAGNNTTVLIAYLPGTDPKNRANHVRVRVQSNENFVAHMEVPARLVAAPDLYECTRPAPRSKGRW